MYVQQILHSTTQHIFDEGSEKIYMRITYTYTRLYHAFADVNAGKTCI